MLLSPELLVVPGPPPQAVLDQKPLWRILYFLLGITFVLRMVGLDIAGALLSAVMFCFAVLCTRDGLADLCRYALIYGVLSLMNLVFDLLPLLYCWSGRMESQVTPMDPAGDERAAYTVTTESHPFFDFSQGIAYNAQSVAMITSPIAMLLGAYLGISAHNEVHRLGILDEDVDFYQGRGPGGQFTLAAGQRALETGNAAAAANASMRYGSLPGGPTGARRFEGTSYKLGG